MDEKAGKVLVQFQQHLKKTYGITRLPWAAYKLGIDEEGQLGIVDSEKQWSLPSKDLSMRTRLWIA